MRTAQAALAVCLLALPWLALAPAAPAQADPACTPDGADLVCVWEGAIDTQLPDEAGPGEQCLHTTSFPTRPKALLEHRFHVPFPASIAAHLTMADGSNDMNIFLDGPGGLINRSYANEPAQVFHRLSQPADLALRASLDGSSQSTAVPLPVAVAERYRLEVRLTPIEVVPAPFQQQHEVNLDGDLPANQYSILCGAVNVIWNMTVDAPAIVEFDVEVPPLNFSYVYPSDDYRLVLRDALGKQVADFRVSSALGTFGVVANEGFGWGDWYLTFMLDDRLGVGDPHRIHVTVTSSLLSSITPPSPPVVPREPLLADPSDDTTDGTLDVLAGWFSEDTSEWLAFHVLLATVPDGGLGERGIERRYEAAWTYAGARVALTHQPQPSGPGSFNASLEDADTRRLSAVPGFVTPGTPGTITFLVPKAFVGSPVAGRPLEDVAIITFQRQPGPVPSSPLSATAGEFAAEDGTVAGVSYIVGGAPPAAASALQPAAFSAAAGPWGALSSVNSVLGIASALALGAIGAAALLARRRA